LQCNYCEWRCELERDETGVCGMYREQEGEIKECYPFCWTSLFVSHIESIPFYHVYPGSRSLVIGSLGCNFDCHYCSNAYVAKAKPETVYKFKLSPEQLVKKARQTGCHNIVFAVNEPVMSWPSLLELSRMAREEGLIMGCLSNGYMTEETAVLMAEVFSFINISLKSIRSDFYRRYAGVPGVDPVLRNIKLLAGATHLELTTPIIQTINDVEIPEMADFIHSIDPEIPWHVFRLLPEYKMQNYQYPDITKVNVALRKVKEKLSYIYFSNFVGSDWVSTLCPDCGEILVERINSGGCGAKMIAYFIDEDRCPRCRRKIRLKGKRMFWQSGGEMSEVGNY